MSHMPDMRSARMEREFEELYALAVGVADTVEAVPAWPRSYALRDACALGDPVALATILRDQLSAPAPLSTAGFVESLAAALASESSTMSASSSRAMALSASRAARASRLPGIAA